MTPEDICQVGLSHLAQEVKITSISPSDGSTEADLCERFYPIARDWVLERHSWRFATRRAQLAQTATNELDGMWAFSYVLPSECVKPILILPPQSVNDDDGRDIEFEVEADSSDTPRIYTNQETAVLKYVKSVKDTSLYTPGFLLCVSWYLAHLLAGPITKKKAVVEWTLQQFNIQLALATAADASARRTNRLKNYVAGHLAARKN